jgi:hypothetical protein
MHALSNGALVSAVSLILCTGKWRKLFAETVLVCIQPPFLAVRTQLRGKTSAPFEKAGNFGLETAVTFLHLLYIFA